ncbi:uncharacterized protein LOC123549986 [Mercenaria mercenaria]|uniref:uncharacterized protein LOC123549986 n=1 Tax=Mercenaria mercenaria TaxID=6596 RepID=UPI00234E6CAF|nr:uncharacterized protein LOC123549986 [Mercenaria mercenaria]
MCGFIKSSGCLYFGLLWIMFLGNTLCFVLTDGLDTHSRYCADSPKANCLLLDCRAFPDEASKFCPRTCGICRGCEDNINTDCTIFSNQLLCTNSRLLQSAAEFCPKHCNFCTPCVDVDSYCAGLDQNLYCDLPQVATNCSKTCHTCKAFNATEFVNQYYVTNASTTSISTATTTTTATTTALTTSFTTRTTLPPIDTKGCDKYGVIVGVAKGDSISYPGTSTCSDGTHQPSEALIQKYCGAPNVVNWKVGAKVIENCSEVPHYTAIAAVTFGGSTLAGVFVKCEVGGFQAAIQTCGSQLKLYHVSASSTSDIPSADNFVILDWKN